MESTIGKVSKNKLLIPRLLKSPGGSTHIPTPQWSDQKVPKLARILCSKVLIVILSYPSVFVYMHEETIKSMHFSENLFLEDNKRMTDAFERKSILLDIAEI